MIVYDGKKWSDLFRHLAQTFKQSYNLKQLSKFMAVVTIYSVAITIVNVNLLEDYLAIDTVFFSLIGVILSLFMVFRLNSAYDRWWEGRKLWGKLTNDSRTFALNLNAHLEPTDKKRRRFFVRNIANFAMALKWHLRDESSTDELIHINMRYAEDLESVNHMPNKIVSFMYIEVEHMHKEGVISDFDKDRLFGHLQGMIDVLGGCERIKKTPIPFSHSTFIKMFTLIYLIILPFGLVDVFGYLTIPAVMIMGFAMLGVEVISEEIENPFGYDANDLPVSAMADGIREGVYEILQVKSSFVAPTQAKVNETEVLH
ncbi:bestrophin family protein [Crocinitomix catalasitica]|nr:bestrophin family protein [Crocinitomix catalasitica]